MTVIVAARTSARVGRKVHNGVTVAADTMITDGWVKGRNARAKLWWTSSGLIVGSAGFVSASQTLEHMMDWPYYPSQQDYTEWLVSVVRPAILATLYPSGTTRDWANVIDTNCALVVATGSHAATFDNVLGVWEPPEGRMAVGSGYEGALAFLGKEGSWKPEDLVEAARRAAEVNVYCDKPVHWANTWEPGEVHVTES